MRRLIAPVFFLLCAKLVYLGDQVFVALSDATINLRISIVGRHGANFRRSISRGVSEV